MELVTIQFRRRAVLVGGAMYLPGEIAGVPREVAEDLCADNDNPTATLFVKSLDLPPVNKMVASPEKKKGRA